MIDYSKNLSLLSLFYVDENGLICQEEFRDVLGYENHYKVSNLGRVKSLKLNKERIRKIQKDQDGYSIICLSNGKWKTFSIHMLVGNSFLNYNDYDSLKYEVDHKNNIKSDNRLINLQVITKRLNYSKDKKNKTSKYTGVNWYPQTNKWQSGIYHIDRRVHLGYFNSEEEANESYKLALYAIENGLEIQKANNNFSSKYKGVTFHKKAKKWCATASVDGKRKHIGLFTDELSAHKAYENLINKKSD